MVEVSNLLTSLGGGDTRPVEVGMEDRYSSLLGRETEQSSVRVDAGTTDCWFAPGNVNRRACIVSLTSDAGHGLTVLADPHTSSSTRFIGGQGANSNGDSISKIHGMNRRFVFQRHGSSTHSALAGSGGRQGKITESYHLPVVRRT